LPSYLSHYDTSLISGLEPLEPTGPIDFEYVRGFNEFLPWPDGSFNTIVSGTSLDHVISLEQSLTEVKRVLSPNGRYLVWLASVPGAPAYDESAICPQPIDDFHMFHFDRVWVEPLFERFFKIQDVTVVGQPGFDHVFYCLLPRS
jgi:ubiquinone/menaquinone biosynthesis C-methylase UbiE